MVADPDYQEIPSCGRPALEAAVVFRPRHRGAEHRPARPALATALLILAAIVVAALQPGRSVGAVAANFFSFFTIQSNLFAAGCVVAPSSAPARDRGSGDWIRSAHHATHVPADHRCLFALCGRICPEDLQLTVHPGSTSVSTRSRRSCRARLARRSATLAVARARATARPSRYLAVCWRLHAAPRPIVDSVPVSPVSSTSARTDTRSRPARAELALSTRTCARRAGSVARPIARAASQAAEHRGRAQCSDQRDACVTIRPAGRSNEPLGDDDGKR